MATRTSALAVVDHPTSVPFLELRRELSPHSEELERAAIRVIRGGHFILGPEVAAFEKEWGEACEQACVVTCGNGLDALRMGLWALGIGPGDEVIVPNLTFIATALAVVQCGAVPVVVDVDPRTLLMDPACAARAVSPRTKAAIPVHLYGQMADMQQLRAALPERVALLEDAAQAHLCRQNGRAPGALTSGACYSFYPGKNMGALGDGGAFVCDDPDVASRARKFANYGQAIKYVHEFPGINSRLDEIQAAFLRVRIPHLARANARRCELAQIYFEQLGDLQEITTLSIAAENHANFHIFPIRVAASARLRLQTQLAARGITTLIHYPYTLSETPALLNLCRKPEPTPHADDAAHTLLSLPMGSAFADEEIRYVAQAIRQCLDE